MKKFSVKIFDVCIMFGTHLEDTDPSMPLFYFAAYICNLFNMCNVFFVIEWNLKAFFLSSSYLESIQ